jgi:hypothetical protein
MRILAIDPGNTESGYALIDSATCQPINTGKISNYDLREMITAGQFTNVDHVSIEMVASYGMAVGKEVFETCVWIGRYLEVCLDRFWDVDLVYRRDVKLHHCHTSKAKDSNITQALVDRFASGVPNHGKGSKANPGWFYGFKADIWQAYALAVYTADTLTAAVDVPVGAHVREVAS